MDKRDTSLFLKEFTAYADKQRRESTVAVLDKAATASTAFKILLEGFTGLAAQHRTPTRIHHHLLRVKYPFLCFSYSTPYLFLVHPFLADTPALQHPGFTRA